MITTWFGLRGGSATPQPKLPRWVVSAASFVAILATLCVTEVVLGQDPGNAATLAARMTRPTEPLLEADATGPGMVDSSTLPDTESPMFVPDDCSMLVLVHLREAWSMMNSGSARGLCFATVQVTRFP